MPKQNRKAVRQEGPATAVAYALYVQAALHVYSSSALQRK
jgi:hypothetical protein